MGRPMSERTRPAKVAWALLLALPLLVPIATTNFTALGADRSWTAEMLTTGKAAVLTLLLAGCAGTWGWDLVRGRTSLKWARELWLAVAFLGLAAVSTLTAVNKWTAVFGTLEYRQGLITIAALGILTLLAMQLVRGTSDVKWLAVAVALGGVPVAAYAITQVAGLDTASWGAPAWALARGTSTIGNPDTLGGFLILPAALALGLALAEERTAVRLGWWAAFATGLVAVLLTQTRSAWLGMALAAGVLIARSLRAHLHLRREDWVAIALIIVLLAVAGFALGEGIAGRVAEVVKGDAGEGSGRLPLWGVGLRVVAEHPLVGVGPDSFRFGYYEARTTANALLGGYGTVADDAHSLPIMVAATIGVPALLVLLVFGFLVLRGAWRQAFAADPGADRTVFAGWLAAICGNGLYLMFGPSVLSSNLVLALGVGVLLAAGARPGRLRGRGPALAVVVIVAAITLLAAGVSVRDLAADYYHARSLDVTGPDAIARIERAVRLSPWTYDYRAEYARYRGDAAVAAAGTAGEKAAGDVASAAYEDLALFSPDEYLTYVHYVEVIPLSDAAAAQRMLAVAQRGIAVNPDGLYCRWAGAVASLRLGRPEEAIRLLDKRWSVDPKFAEPGIAYGTALGTLGRYDEAESVLDWLEKRFPDDPGVVGLRDRLVRSEGVTQ